MTTAHRRESWNHNRGAGASTSTGTTSFNNSSGSSSSSTPSKSTHSTHRLSTLPRSHAVISQLDETGSHARLSLMSTSSSLNQPRPALLKSSSNTSDGLGYYFSSYADGRTSSSTSSLSLSVAMSPNTSNDASLSASPSSSISLSDVRLAQVHTQSQTLTRTAGEGSSEMDRGQSTSQSQSRTQSQSQGGTGTSLEELIDEEKREEESRSADGRGSGQGFQSEPGDVPLPRPTLGGGGAGAGAGESEAGPSNRRIHVVSYPSANSVPQVDKNDSGISPGGFSESSGASQYSYNDGRRPSIPDSTGSENRDQQDFFLDPALRTGTPSDSGSFLSEYRARFQEYADGLSLDSASASDAQSEGDGAERVHGLMADWDEERDQGTIESGVSVGVRESMQSGTTVRPARLDDLGYTHEEETEVDEHQTPVPSMIHRGRKHSVSSKSQNTTPNPSVDITPTIGGPAPELTSAKAAANATASPVADLYTSGRLAFVAPADVSQQSLDELQREVEASSSRNRMSVSVAEDSAGDFGPTRTSTSDDGEEDEDTVKGRKGINGNVLSAEPTGLFASPVKALSSTPRRERDASPAKSPQPPPRSTLRPFPSPNPSRTPSENSIPTIINTASTPDTTSTSTTLPKSSLVIHPPRPSRSPSRDSPKLPSAASINDLTDLLGGAIDAIGLMDSRDTPPPSVIESSKEVKGLNLTSVFPKLPDKDDPALEQNAILPQRGVSLPGSSASAPPSQPATRSSTQTQPPGKRRSSQSFLSTSTYSAHSPGVQITPTARPWPAAMLYSHIKGMKNAGDRSKAYARAINELAKAETGLREWSIASTSQAHRPLRESTHKYPTSLGTSTAHILPVSKPHHREVSASSEFPMRADSYAAREISTRMIDPEDRPTSLPSGLPYPQLQPQPSRHDLQSQYHHHAYQAPYGSGSGSGAGMKPSQSIQSMASISTFSGEKHKRGFLSAIGRISGKRDHGASGLGPPQNPGYSHSHAPAGNKKDIRGLPISSPSPSQESLQQQQGGGGLRTASISAPMGPRGPRGSYTPPPGSSDSLLQQPPSRNSIDIIPRGGGAMTSTGRASFDTGAGLARYLPGGGNRASLDGGGSGARPMGMGTKGSLTPSLGTGTGTGSGTGTGTPTVRDEDVRQMTDVLPNVERGVVRRYLLKYGEPMRAIGAYLEDEKRGTVMR